jgi:alkanesulfonate monooxygenase SsuD/methylene tetrahydromethanopterin reductase-like flavin-dependent oxidoreductase (luciferase family)
MIEGQQGVTWDDWCTLADAAQRLGMEGLFRSDHYFSAAGVSGHGATDAWTTLGALAARTTTLRLGTLVSPVTFRAPAVLAKAVLTVDLISDGRVEVGMGAGWWEEEHTRFGLPFYDVNGRWERLEEQVPIVHALLRDEQVSFRGKHYQLESADPMPASVQRPHPPLILGGRTVGPRMQALVAGFADEFNTHGGSPARVAARYARARDAVEAAGRPRDDIITSWMTWFFLGRTETEYVDKLRRAHSLDPSAGSFDAYRADIEEDCIVGTPDRAIARLREYAAAGVQRIFANHELYDDLEMLELLATQVLPEIP